MRKITQTELKEIFRLHKLWIQGDVKGVRANLSGAILANANLTDAILARANLSGAILTDANLARAILVGAKLSRAVLPIKIVQVGPIGSRSDYTVYNVTDDIVQCGCWLNHKGGSLDEFISRIDEIYPAYSANIDKQRYRDEYLAVIEYFKILRKTARRQSGKVDTIMIAHKRAD